MIFHVETRRDRNEILSNGVRVLEVIILEDILESDAQKHTTHLMTNVGV